MLDCDCDQIFVDCGCEFVGDSSETVTESVHHQLTTTSSSSPSIITTDTPPTSPHHHRSTADQTRRFNKSLSELMLV